MKAAISLCPNDTFIFYAWAHGLISAPKIDLDYFDIEQLNEKASEGIYPALKISTIHYGKISNDYQILKTGAALGYNVGPKIISKKPYTLQDLPSLRIAIPGRHTTTHALIQNLCPEAKEKHFCLYHEIEELIEKGIVDCGAIIHETRFGFLDKGFYEVTDLGTLWNQKFNLPLPLGVFVAKRSLGQYVLEEIERAMQASLEYAWKHAEETLEFMQEKSIEKDPHIIRDHVDLYVTKESFSLSSEGLKAIDTLLEVSSCPT